jgi:sulfur relay (sulfurtransferase) complex TusBCD TusD component (DsrE family)
LDGIAFIERGGENGSIVEPGIADSSSLYHRLMLPLEDEDHMPPNEKPQPSSSEIALIQAWINEGADFDLKISECDATEKIKGYFNSLVEQSQQEKLIPEKEVMAADEKVLATFRQAGIIALPVSRESNYLSISFVNKRSVSAGDLQLLLQLKNQIVWMDLARTTVSDPDLNIVAQLSSLRRLNLEYTAITNRGLMALSPLSNLHYLNLVGTKITGEGLQHIVAMKNLRSLFLYQTAVTGAEIENFTKEAPQIQLDTGGYQLPKMLTDSIITKFKSL